LITGWNACPAPIPAAVMGFGLAVTVCKTRKIGIIIQCGAHPVHLYQAGIQKRRCEMGDKGGKKNKNKSDKQKSQQDVKKKDDQKSKLPSKKPA
jgi:hypothetical protein